MKILYFSSTIIKTSLKIFFIAFLFSSKSYSSTNYCDFEKAKYLKELNSKKNILQIDIKTNNLKGWSKNNLKILQISLISRKAFKFFKIFSIQFISYFISIIT